MLHARVRVCILTCAYSGPPAVDHPPPTRVQAYGKKGMGEVPPNQTLDIEVELLAIKEGPWGVRVKLVEG